MKLAIIDIDGTITDFYAVDHRIIGEIYKSPVVKIFDKFLWAINGLDIISNNYFIFKLRIIIYSMLSFRCFKKDLASYREKYIQYAPHFFEEFTENEYKLLKKRGYKVVLLTCDPFDAYLNKNVIVTQNKKAFVQYNIAEKYEKVCIIGNNYMDDIRSGLNVRKKNKKTVQVYYVGKSNLLKKFLKNKGVVLANGLKNAVKMIK